MRAVPDAPRSRAVLIGALAVLALTAVPRAATAAPAHDPGPTPSVRAARAVETANHAPPAPAWAGPHGALRPLAELSARRLRTADLVAAAKWETGQPIDDPERERQVLAAAARQTDEVGGEPVATVAVFRDQIEANKLVQHALHRRWRAAPDQAPTERPDLARVRAEINRINGGLVRAIAVAEPARTAWLCPVALLPEAARAHRDQALDGPHGVALARALRSVCAPPPTASAGRWPRSPVAP
ncbi:gamma subclass chorismate mutase AroQ [Streptomyces sp. AC536]|uniref:gamma subclass chorismate mutase AroQ n=1 Tax=Streptomyces buecherae TaxID=2763006 RepID=UPI00164E44B6|nr:gamma subclass chorismate mutase AroQ [Streptomyces buecherae]MBC3984190.1 gamma subclass chorismate mutase AroQ [Streptomyces buecherae]QNJ38867.1 gamma subclass chorismate mutase AroQ [Streptomyces buecherae]